MIPKVSAIVVPAVCLAVLLAPPSGTAGTTDGAAAPDQAARRGLAWLLGTQLPVGGWEIEPHGLTSTGHKLAVAAAAAHAMVATSDSEEVLAATERAVGFLSHYEGELREPRLTDGFDYTPWAAAFGLVHLRGVLARWSADREPPGTESLVRIFGEFAIRTQRPCGGWDYRVTGSSGSRLTDGSVPFLTAAMLEGLLAWDLEPAARGRAVQDLEGITDEKGLLGYSHDGAYREVRSAPWWSPKEAAGRTLQARLVLARCGRCDAATLRAALDQFLEVRSDYAAVRNEPDHVKPIEIAGYYYYHAHAYAMSALRYLLDQDPEAESATLRQAGQLVSTLLSEQAADGSWVDAPAGGKAYGTSLALLMLRDYRDIRVRWFDDVAAGLDRAGKTGRPAVLLFLDDNEASRKMVRLFYEPLLADLLRQVVLIRLDRRANPDIARRAQVYQGPSLVLLDARIEDPLKHPLKKLIGGRDAKKVAAVIEKVLETCAAEDR